MRGQITIFLILGLVILASFVLIFYVSAGQHKAKLERGTDRSSENALQDAALDAYVEQCLRKTTERGLKLLGLQGGKLFAPPLQNGTITPSPEFEFSGMGIPIDYGVIFPPNLIGFPEPPEYPMRNTPFGSSPLEADQTALGLAWGYFGQKHLPPLCEQGGTNDIAIGDRDITPCDKGFYGVGSIQWQLEKFVQEEFRGCIDAAQLGRGLQHSLGKPNVTVTLGETNIFVNASFAVSTEENGQRNTRIHFQTHSAVRLRKVYQYLDSLLLLDTYYLNYPVMERLQENRFWESDFRVERSCPNCAAGDHTTILTIIDEASALNVSEPFLFRTAIQNRRPALNYIHQASSLSARDIDLIVPAGEKITIQPLALDPDDDEMRYTYSGWKEDYQDTFSGLSNCCLQPGLNAYHDCQQELFAGCVSQIPQTNKPLEWSRSPLYLSSGRDASVATATNDIGRHMVRITARDPAGLEDYQDINILVIPPEGAVGNFVCTSNTEEPLKCSCGSGAGVCAGKPYEELGQCIGDTLCTTSCEAWEKNSKAEACLQCKGATYEFERIASGITICCQPEYCGVQSGTTATCLAPGAVQNPLICCSNQMRACTAERESAQLCGKTCQQIGDQWSWV